MRKLFYSACAVAAGLGLNQVVEAADITAVSGVYSTESTKVEGAKAGGESTLSGGLRFHDKLGVSPNVAWYGLASLQLSSYEAPENAPSPDNFTGLSAGGGLRYYFSPFSEFVVPFISGGVSYRNYQDVNFDTSSYVQTRTSGIFYGMAAGVRLGLDQRFFFEIEMPFFSSPLWAVETRETASRATNGTVTTQKRETTRKALYADSRGLLTDVLIGIGMKF